MDFSLNIKWRIRDGSLVNIRINENDRYYGATLILGQQKLKCINWEKLTRLMHKEMFRNQTPLKSYIKTLNPQITVVTTFIEKLSINHNHYHNIWWNFFFFHFFLLSLWVDNVNGHCNCRRKSNKSTDDIFLHRKHTTLAPISWTKISHLLTIIPTPHKKHCDLFVHKAQNKIN